MMFTKSYCCTIAKTIIIAILFTLGFGLTVSADNESLLKQDVPQLDTKESIHHETHPLKGKVEKTDQWGNPLGGFASGSTYGFKNKRYGRSQKNNFNAQVESGVGIIGVKFMMFVRRPPVINRVFSQTPAAQVGLKAKDIIVAVDGVPTVGLTKEEVYDMIVGTPGTQVTLSIQRGEEYMAVTMTRMDLNAITDPFVRRDYMISM